VCVCTRRRGVLAGFTLGGSRDETWRGQGIRKRSVLEFAKTESIVTVQWRTYRAPVR
jgi:hypothetical protein